MKRVKRKNTIEMSDRIIAEIKYLIGNIEDPMLKSLCLDRLDRLDNHKKNGKNVIDEANELRNDLNIYLYDRATY